MSKVAVLPPEPSKTFLVAHPASSQQADNFIPVSFEPAASGIGDADYNSHAKSGTEFSFAIHIPWSVGI